MNYFAVTASSTCSCAPGGCCEVKPGGRGTTNSRAWGAFEDDVMRDGWGKLYIHAEPSTQTADDDGSFAAGFLEGYLTAQQISDHYLSWYDYQFGGGSPEENPPSETLVEFMTTQYDWTLAAIANAPKTETEYWAAAGAVMVHIAGLLAGQNAGAPPGARSLSLLDLLLLQAAGDLYDIVPAVTPSLTGAARDDAGAPRPKWRDIHDAEAFEARRHRVVSCSAVVKVAPGDVFAAHATWTSYQNMLRIYKHYELGPKLRRVGFSAKPGMVYSKDDFHVLPSASQKLVVVETTNGILDDYLYSLIVPQALLTWQRVYIANRLASGGKDWTEIHARYNSGTYNNQYFVVDMKLFAPGAALPAGFLWISEQLPGMVARQDVTATLRATGAWPAYNVPYDATIYAVSGYQAAFEEYGDKYSYANCSRAKIFARELPAVASLDDAQRLIRFNQFQTDPVCNEDYEVGNTDPSCALAWRGDLNAAAPAARGAVDGKATAWSRVAPDASGSSVAQSGPSHDDQAPFGWAQFPTAVFFGQPAVFDFSWVEVAFDD